MANELPAFGEGGPASRASRCWSGSSGGQIGLGHADAPRGAGLGLGSRDIWGVRATCLSFCTPIFTYWVAQLGLFLSLVSKCTNFSLLWRTIITTKNSRCPPLVLDLDLGKSCYHIPESPFIPEDGIVFESFQKQTRTGKREGIWQSQLSQTQNLYSEGPCTPKEADTSHPPHL